MYIKEDLIIPHVSLLSPQALGRVALGGARGFGVPGGFSGQSPLCSGSLARAGVAPRAERGLRPACGPAGGWERPRRVISHGFSVPGSSTTASTISSSPRHGGRVVSAPGPASPFPGHLAAAEGGTAASPLQGPSLTSTFMMTCGCSVTPLWRRTRYSGAGVLGREREERWREGQAEKQGAQAALSHKARLSFLSHTRARWCSGAGTRRTSTSSPPAAGSPTTPRRSGTSTR